MAKEKLRKRIAGNRIYATVAEKDRNLDNIVMADKADKVGTGHGNNVASFDSAGNLKDSGVAASSLISKNAAEGGTALSLVTTGEKFNWNTVRSVPASTSADEDKVLTVDDQGDTVWKAFDRDMVGTQLLDEHDQPVLDEESTQENPIYVYDASATDQLWTGFAGKGFGATRAYADQDGNNIKSTYATKDELPSAMTGATAQSAGTSGLVPAPDAGDEGKFLKGDGTWTTIEMAEQRVHVLTKTTGLTKAEFDQAWEWVENGHLVGVLVTAGNGNFQYLYMAEKHYKYYGLSCTYHIVFSYIRYPSFLENQYEGFYRDTLTWSSTGTSMSSDSQPIMPTPLNQFGRYLYASGYGAPEWKTIREVPSSAAADSGKVLTVNSSGTPAWSTVAPYAPTPSANNVLLLGDSSGGKTWTELENDVFGTQLLDEHDQPVLDEESTPTNPIYVYDANSTDQLWTGFSGKGFGAIRAYADQDGNNIKTTYLKKVDLPEMDEATDTEIDNMFTVVIGNRTYRTVTIGNQEWLAENLDYRFECNGSPLPVGEPGVITTPAAWYYDNQPANYGIDGTYKCGLLYNRYAVVYLQENKDMLLPDGWHVPSSYEWETMWREIGERIGTIGSTYNCGRILRASDGSVTSNWPSGWSGTDNYGFTVLPAGRYINSSSSGQDRTTFTEIGTTAEFWTPETYAAGRGNTIGFGVGVDADYPERVVAYSVDPSTFGYGLSLRLVRTIS